MSLGLGAAMSTCLVAVGSTKNLIHGVFYNGLSVQLPEELGQVASRERASLVLQWKS